MWPVCEGKAHVLASHNLPEQIVGPEPGVSSAADEDTLVSLMLEVKLIKLHISTTLSLPAAHVSGNAATTLNSADQVQ